METGERFGWNSGVMNIHSCLFVRPAEGHMDIMWQGTDLNAKWIK